MRRCVGRFFLYIVEVLRLGTFVSPHLRGVAAWVPGNCRLVYTVYTGQQGA